MKKSPSPGGKRLAIRLMCYAVAFFALIAARESFLKDGGPLTDSLGRGFNNVLMVGSKLGLGFALICDEQTARDSAMGRGGQKLGRASHKAYVDAQKVELYGN
jgi:hypothetical protein